MMKNARYCVLYYLFVSQNYKYTKVKQKQENNKILTHNYLHSHALLTTISYTHTYPSVTHKVQVSYNGQKLKELISEIVWMKKHTHFKTCKSLQTAMVFTLDPHHVTV